MAKVSFSKVNTPTPVPGVAVESEGSTCVAELAPVNAVPKTAVAVRATTAMSAYVTDEEDSADASDIILPRINLVQKVGALSDKFNKGDIVLNKSLVLPCPLNVLVLGFRKTQYTEKIAGGEMGRLLDSTDEVAAVGGTLNYNEANATGRPLFQKLATATILIEQPKKVGPEKFGQVFSPTGKRYAVALWSMKGGQYTNGAQIIKTHGKLEHLKSDTVPGSADYTKAFYKLSTKLDSYKTGNSAYVPVLEVGETTTPEFRAWLAAGFR